MALTNETKAQYNTALNHIARVEEYTGSEMSLPFDVTKTLNYVGYLLEVRGCTAKTVSSYLSALRMLHLCQGMDPSCLRPTIVTLILRGQEHFDEVRKTLEQKPKRIAVTVAVMKLLKRMIAETDFDIELKLRLWVICCLMWNGSLRSSEVMSRTENEFDPATTLCTEDIELLNLNLSNGMEKEIIRLHIKSPKERRIGNGVKIEMFGNGSFCCVVRAWKKWTTRVKLQEGQPVFRSAKDKCFTGKEFNKIISKLTSCLTDNTDSVIRSHSFRAGVATEMGQAGFSDKEIMAQGRWSSQAFKLYIKMDRLKRLEFSNRMKDVICS